MSSFTHTFLHGGKDKVTPFSSTLLLGDCDSGPVFTETDTGIAARLTEVTVTSVSDTQRPTPRHTPRGRHTSRGRRDALIKICDVLDAIFQSRPACLVHKLFSSSLSSVLTNWMYCSNKLFVLALIKMCDILDATFQSRPVCLVTSSQIVQ